jgi:hypothetical protein
MSTEAGEVQVAAELWCEMLIKCAVRLRHAPEFLPVKIRQKDACADTKASHGRCSFKGFENG